MSKTDGEVLATPKRRGLSLDGWAVLLAFVFLLWRGVRAAWRAPDGLSPSKSTGMSPPSQLEGAFEVPTQERFATTRYHCCGHAPLAAYRGRAV